MTLQELLRSQISQKPKGWQLPHTLIALDPGYSTGYSIFLDGKHYLNGVIDWQIPVEGFYTMTNMLKHFAPDVIVCEDYRLYASKAKAQTGSQIDTVRIIGAVELLCNQNNIRFYKMMPSTAKGFVTDEKLRSWGLYKKVNPHSRDSLRIAIHWMLFNKDYCLLDN